MKNPLLAVALILSLSIPSLVQAQAPAGPPSGMNSAMLRLFGKNQSFSANADVRILDQNNKEMAQMPMKVAYLEGKIRAEMDMGKMKSGETSAEEAAQMKAMGLDKMTSIIHPETGKMFLIYPSLKSYIQMAVPKEEAVALSDSTKLEKTPLGKETIDGRQTVKNKVVITDPKGNKSELFVWNAPDMKDFPVQMQMSESGSTVIVRYKDLKFEKPDAKLFDAPANFKKYEDMQTMFMATMRERGF